MTSTCTGCDRPIEGVKTCVELGDGPVQVLCEACALDVLPRHKPAPWFVRWIGKLKGTES